MGGSFSSSPADGSDSSSTNSAQVMKKVPIAGKAEKKSRFAESFHATVEGPFMVDIDPAFEKPYILCSVNRNGSSYRSPWSNCFYPRIPFPPTLSNDLRSIELEANFAFEDYYDDGVSSVYVVELTEGFAVVLILKKESQNGSKASWETTHIFRVYVNPDERIGNYTLSSKAMLWLEACGDPLEMQLAGNISYELEKDAVIDANHPHIDIFGIMVDEMELKLRQVLKNLCKSSRIEIPKL